MGIISSYRRDSYWERLKHKDYITESGSPRRLLSSVWTQTFWKLTLPLASRTPSWPIHFPSLLWQLFFLVYMLCGWTCRHFAGFSKLCAQNILSTLIHGLKPLHWYFLNFPLSPVSRLVLSLDTSEHLKCVRSKLRCIISVKHTFWRLNTHTQQ